jgi:hypothetical protein
MHNFALDVYFYINCFTHIKKNCFTGFCQVIRLARKLPTGDVSGLKGEEANADEGATLDENDLT